MKLTLKVFDQKVDEGIKFGDISQGYFLGRACSLNGTRRLFLKTDEECVVVALGSAVGRFLRYNDDEHFFNYEPVELLIPPGLL